MESINAFVGICESLSKMLLEPLYKYIDQNRFNNIFFIPDLNLKYLNLNYMRYNNKWFVEYFRTIENVLDYSLIGKRNNKLHSGKIIANFANPQDKTVSKIYNMTKNNPMIEIQSMDNPQVYINEDIKTYVIVGHGISDLNGYNYSGAKVIKKSKKQTINLSDYLQVNGRIENAMVISCSSGTPIDDYIERNNGLWSSLFEKNIDYILFCKWDVSIKYTSDILETVLKLLNENADMSLSAALVHSQRNCSSLHPVLWAGLEVWKN